VQQNVCATIQRGSFGLSVRSEQLDPLLEPGEELVELAPHDAWIRMPRQLSGHEQARLAEKAKRLERDFDPVPLVLVPTSAGPARASSQRSELTRQNSLWKKT
jgi:hypothetical protein